MEESKNRLELLLKLSVFGVLFGRGLQHILFDIPFRSILWNEDLLAPLFSALSLDWFSYATSKSVDNGINKFAGTIGVVLVLLSLIPLFFIKKFKKLLLPSSFYILFLSVLFFIQKYFIIAQFIEYASQVVAPLALYLWWRGENRDKLELIIKVGVALTFLGHGSYALGIFPVPGNFIDMTINILGCSEASARLILKIMGGLDFIAAALLFLPVTRNWALSFCVIWGLLTTCARILEPVLLGSSNIIIHSGYEFLVRLPHFLMPLFLLISLPNKKGFRMEASFINS
jgi:hypothetical protein